MREFLPKMYDKHNLDRGKRVSQKERDEKGITEECFAYGELDVEIFMHTYQVCGDVAGILSLSAAPRIILYILYLSLTLTLTLTLTLKLSPPHTATSPHPPSPSCSA